MRSLILGAGGQVGRALIEGATDGMEVVALDHRQCDLTFPEAIQDTIASTTPDVVLNAAAYTAVDRAETDSEIARQVNAVAPGIAAAAAAQAGARFVHLSTDFIFDGWCSRPYRPEDAPNPLSVYGQTKLDGERAVAAVDSNNLIVRTAWVYAARGRNFLTTMLRLMSERDRLEVVADQVGTPTHAASLARATWAMVDAKIGNIQHYTDAGVASWYDFAVAIQEEALAIGLLDRQIEIAPIATEAYPTPAKRPSYSVLDKTATWKLIGAPAPHWRVSLRDALKEYRDG